MDHTTPGIPVGFTEIFISEMYPIETGADLTNKRGNRRLGPRGIRGCLTVSEQRYHLSVFQVIILFVLAFQNDSLVCFSLACRVLI